MKDMTFAEYLEEVEGIDWNYFDDNYSSPQADEIYQRYLEYTEKEN